VDVQPRDTAFKPGEQAVLGVAVTPHPEATEVRHQWFDADTREKLNGKSDALLTTDRPGTYYVEATAVYSSGVDASFPGPREVTVQSRFVTVTCVPPEKPLHKRRAVRSSATTATAPAQAVVLEVIPEEGVSYTWYEGDDYANTTRPVASGPVMAVTPIETTTYWVMATAPCPPSQTRTDSEFFVVQVGCGIVMTSEPEPASVAMRQSGEVSLTASVAATGPDDLHYQWHVEDPNLPDSPGTPVGSDSSTYTWSHTPDGTPTHRDVYVVIWYGAAPQEEATCFVRSRTVRLSIVSGVPQSIFAYTPGATVYAPQFPEILSVVMDPPAGPDHTYHYSLYRDDGTPTGELRASGSTEGQFFVSTDSIDTFWIVVRGVHSYPGGSYEETSITKRMYVSRYGTCAMPLLQVAQSLVRSSTAARRR
jgi:uncharacterized protein YndB with AHSA1/START domain